MTFATSNEPQRRQDDEDEDEKVAPDDGGGEDGHEAREDEHSEDSEYDSEYDEEDSEDSSSSSEEEEEEEEEKDVEDFLPLDMAKVLVVELISCFEKKINQRAIATALQEVERQEQGGGEGGGGTGNHHQKTKRVMLEVIPKSVGVANVILEQYGLPCDTKGEGLVKVLLALDELQERDESDTIRPSLPKIRQLFLPSVSLS